MNPSPCQSVNTVSFVSVLVPFLRPAWRLVRIRSVLADLNEKCVNVFLHSFPTLWTLEFLVLSSMASIFKLPSFPWSNIWWTNLSPPRYLLWLPCSCLCPLFLAANHCAYFPIPLIMVKCSQCQNVRFNHFWLYYLMALRVATLLTTVTHHPSPGRLCLLQWAPSSSGRYTPFLLLQLHMLTFCLCELWLFQISLLSEVKKHLPFHDWLFSLSVMCTCTHVLEIHSSLSQPLS